MNSEKHIARDQIASLLYERPEVSVPADVSRHLEDCPDCRARLEQVAADPSWWSRLEDLDNSDLDSTFASPAVDRATTGRDRLESGIAANADDEHAELLDAPSHPEMLGQLNQFEIERVIGRGGMGLVFKGFDRELHRTVAIKLMSPHLAYNATARKRFEREARAAAAVVHPNVIPIHGVSLFKNQPLIVMPLIAGSSLQSLVEMQGPLDTKDVVRIGLQIAAGLSAAHDQGLIHRDIKPANILLEQDVSRVVITDFGLARAADELAMTQTGWLAGTPHYMSPEQARGAAIDTRSDLFSLGGVLYFIATGREPFRAEKPVAVLHKICHDPATPAKQINSDIPQTLSDIIERLLEKNPQDRFPTAARVQKLFEEYLAELQQPNRVHRPLRIVTQRQVRRRWRVIQAVALFVLVIAVAGSAGWVSNKYFSAGLFSLPRRAETAGGAVGNEVARSKLKGLLPPEQFNNELLAFDQELNEMERRLEWGLPATNVLRGAGSVLSLDQRGVERVESYQTIVNHESAENAASGWSNDSENPLSPGSSEPCPTEQDDGPPAGDSLSQSIWRWLEERWPEQVDAVLKFFNR